MMPPRSHPSVQSRLDFLEQPAVAVRIAERGIRAVGATFRIEPRHARFRRGDTAAALEMEHLAHLDPAACELGACRLYVMDDEHQSLDRARRGRRDSLAEVDG